MGHFARAVLVISSKPPNDDRNGEFPAYKRKAIQKAVACNERKRARTQTNHWLVGQTRKQETETYQFSDLSSETYAERVFFLEMITQSLLFGVQKIEHVPYPPSGGISCRKFVSWKLAITIPVFRLAIKKWADNSCEIEADHYMLRPFFMAAMIIETNLKRSAANLHVSPRNHKTGS